MNWDDLRILIAVRNEGTFARAGAALRIDETTVARRLNRLEKQLGRRLFDAIDGTRHPTEYCNGVLAHADEVARQVSAITSLPAAGSGLAGHIRIATTPSIADEVLAPRAGKLLHEHPGLTLQFMASGQNVNFSRWEADLAVRLGRPAKGDFVISRLAQLRLYYFEAVDEASHSGKSVVCAFPKELDGTPESQFLTDRAIKGDARLITDSPATIRALVQSYTARGVLPEYACASLLSDPKLQATQLPHRRDAWLLVQTHLKRDPAARRVIEWIRSAFAEALG
ncbi:MAG: LysR family transcriptional regulator [Pseudomonadota bacterium]